MAALYSYRFLNDVDYKDTSTPAQRYLYKYENHRKEIKHLKLHEKNFLFRVMRVLEDASGQRSYDLFNIPEAREFVFNWIILLHAGREMVFEGTVLGPNGPLTPAEKI